MSARALLKQLRERGLELSTDGGRLLYRPKNLVTPVLLGALQAHKPRLIKHQEWERRKLEEADRRGLVIRWSDYPKWIEMHDPLSGEWHEVRASECLPGVVERMSTERQEGRREQHGRDLHNGREIAWTWRPQKEPSTR